MILSAQVSSQHGDATPQQDDAWGLGGRSGPGSVQDDRDVRAERTSGADAAENASCEDNEMRRGMERGLLCRMRHRRAWTEEVHSTPDLIRCTIATESARRNYQKTLAVAAAAASALLYNGLFMLGALA